MRGIFAAWALAVGVLTWREIEANRKPPPAGRYLAASGLFGALGLLAEYQPAAGAAAVAAWGFDLALILQPGFLPGTGAPLGGGSTQQGTGTTPVPGQPQPLPGGPKGRTAPQP